jgi:hypothetical protein
LPAVKAWGRSRRRPRLMFAYGPKRRSVALQRYVRSGGEADTPRQWTDAFDPEPTFAQGICNARIWLAL